MKQERYQSYLLRVWQTDDQDEPAWRVQIECLGTGERKGFSSLEGLYRFLAQQTELQGPVTRPSPGSRSMQQGAAGQNVDQP